MKAARTKPLRRDVEAPALDWRTGRGYPPLTASASEFAWQFLRRNPEYRADWQRYADELRARAKESAELADFARWRLDESSDEYAVGSVRLRRGAWQTPLESQYANKWALTTFIDPARGTLPDGAGSWKLAAGAVSFLRWSFDADQQQAMSLEQPSQLIVRMDVRVPPTRLLDTLERLIDKVRKELRIEAPDSRSRPREWIAYLRLLDADEAGASTVDICDALWPKLAGSRQRLDKARAAARALRDAGYLTLPLLGKVQRKK